jgi:hypothetical protein
MRFIMMVKGTKTTEAGAMPAPAEFAAMDVYNQQLIKAGVLADAAGLKPTSKGFKIRYVDGKAVKTDGPFEQSDIVSGFWVINVASYADAVAWAMKAPDPQFGRPGGEIEVRPFFEAEDFGG